MRRKGSMQHQTEAELGLTCFPNLTAAWLVADFGRNDITPACNLVLSCFINIYLSFIRTSSLSQSRRSVASHRATKQRQLRLSQLNTDDAAALLLDGYFNQVHQKANQVALRPNDASGLYSYQDDVPVFICLHESLLILLLFHYRSRFIIR